MRKNHPSKIIVIFLLTAAILLSCAAFFTVSANSVSTGARAATLYEPESGRFLYSKNAHERLGMASTTKVMTALITAENLPLDKTVCVPKVAEGTEGSSAYLKEGEEFTVEDLLFALLLQSANDAAVTLACAVAGSVEAFALLMNDKADALGLEDTNFTNPHGLDSEEHYTTAHDLALIAAAALENEAISRIVKTKKHTVEKDDITRVFYNHNKLLSLYDGAVGVKTGYTKATGRCLVGAAQRDGVKLISVTLDAPNDWSDHARMLDFGFSITENRLLMKASDFLRQIPIEGSEKSSVTVGLKDDVRAVFLKTDAEPELEVLLSERLEAPIKEGDTVGNLIFTLDGKQVAKAPIVAKESAPSLAKDKGFFGKIKDFFTKRNHH